MEIPVVFATDKNYIFYTVTAVASMAENAGEDTFYRIYILVSGELGKGHPLLTGVQEKYPNIQVELLPVEDRVFENVHINNSHVTKTTFYRLLLAEMLQEDKCLYLDSDIIVRDDLQELYLTEMENEYIAGVRDLWIDLLPEANREKRRKKTRIPSLDQYVNAGVLLLHLKKIREDHMTKQFCEHMKTDYPYEDQDIVNVCCYNHIRHLPAKWNLFTLFMGRLDELEGKGIDRETIRQMREKQGIIHYATPFIRPWESERFLCNDIWWEYASVWSQTPEYRKLRKDMRRREIGYSAEKMVSYCAGYEKVFIWGFTAVGRIAFSMLSEAGTENIICFIDNDPEKQKFTYCGKPVIPFDAWKYEPGKSAVIIASQKRGKEVRQILLCEGIREDDVVLYINKDEIYYQCLRPEYYEGDGKYD